MVKLVWAFVFIVLTAFTGYILIAITCSYFEYNVISTVRMKIELIQFYPVVTICYSHPFSTYTSEMLMKNLSLNKFGVDMNKSTHESSSAKKVVTVSQTESFDDLPDSLKSKFSFVEQYKAEGFCPTEALESLAE